MTDLPAHPRAALLVRQLGLVPHPEGGWYREVFRSPHAVDAGSGRPHRSALTTIDFVLDAGGASAWHRVASDEVWHLLEGGPLRLWLIAPALDALEIVELGAPDGRRAPRHVVPAGWWQAAEPLAGFAYAGATVGPGFDFADFSFGRDDAGLVDALGARWPQAVRLLG
jgi:uncharacterized protein